MSETYNKRTRCPNCCVVVNIAIPKGTKVKGFVGDCPNCGVKIRLITLETADDWKSTLDRHYDFLRDFFGLRKVRR